MKHTLSFSGTESLNMDAMDNQVRNNKKLRPNPVTIELFWRSSSLQQVVDATIICPMNKTKDMKRHDLANLFSKTDSNLI